ncbi:GMC family oxidoreductase [Gordonia sinesedis]
MTVPEETGGPAQTGPEEVVTDTVVDDIGSDGTVTRSVAEEVVAPAIADQGTGTDYDVLVIGSGFGGSVAALRLTEKGYRVGVLEAGARFTDDDFAKTSFDLRRFLFAPAVGCYGIQRIDSVRDALILAGAGVGGGSLVYANTLYEPLPAFYTDPQWRDITDWRAELAPYYDQAKRMLGVVDNPVETPSDGVMRKVAEEMGVGDTFHPTPVGVFFGGPGQSEGETVADPYFGGAGPDRKTCLNCGECMTGCRHNAKNTLVKNYLYLAEQGGAEILPLTTVTDVRPLDGGGYAVDTVRTDAKLSRRRSARTLTADQVVFAAASLGTQKLLHRMKDEGKLPRLSDRLGYLSRTNSESILGAMAPDLEVDYTRGVAITSSFHPDDDTHIEPVRYGKGSNSMAFLQTILTDGGGSRPRWLTWLTEMAKHPKDILGPFDVKHWSERSVIALVMQTLDNSITTYGKRNRLTGRWKMTSRQGHGEPNPTWIPVANKATRILAKLLNGTPYGTIGEPFNMPMTAHFIGGCVIAETPESGVIDAYQRMFGYQGLHVMDGAAISANLGVNPSLTITAQAERAMAYWPNKGQPDPRPTLGEPYRRIAPVAPESPAVPSAAPGALRLPLEPV